MIAIPDRMKHLKVDARGFAIPYGVVTDRNGVVHFAMNDEHIRINSLVKELCSLCGKSLLRGRWIVGGALSAFHPQGAFVDPPMHSECCHYALQVCPYLAAPRYVKEVGEAKADAHKEALANVRVIADNTQIPGRPAGDIFVALMHTGKIDIDPQTRRFKPIGKFANVEFWRHGQQIDTAEGWRTVRDRINEFEAAQ